MDRETLFAHAVRLAEANIRAGQFNDTNRFETIVADHVTIAFTALETIWTEASREGELH